MTRVCVNDYLVGNCHLSSECMLQSGDSANTHLFNLNIETLEKSKIKYVKFNE